MANVDSLSIQITASTASAKQRVDALVASLNNLVTAINGIDSSKIESLALAVNNLGNGLSSLKGTNIKSITKVADALNEVNTKGSTAFEPIVQGAEQLAEETSAVSQGVEKVNTDLTSLNAEPLQEMASSAENVSNRIENTSSKMSRFKLLLSNLKIIVPTDSLDNVNKKIDRLKEKISDLKDKLNYKSANQQDYIDSDEMERDKAQIQGLINELDRLQLKQKELQSHGGFKFNGSGIFSGLSQAISNFHGKVSALSKKLDGLASKFRHVSKASQSTAKSTDYFKTASDRLVKSLTKVTRMLRLMILRMALRTVIKEVGNGFKSLALHCEDFDNAMSNLRNSAKTLGYSFAGMVAPLLQALAPALIYIINLLMKLMNAINQVFSALSGKSTWNKAKDFTGKWSDDIKAANKEAKQLKKTLLSFDELNQLQEKTSGGGDTSGNIEDMFETMEVEQKWKDVANYIKNLAKKLFDPIKKAWEKVGDFVKKSWKYAMDEVLKLGESVARDFWKVWEQEKTQKIFENILKIIGWIGQTVGNLARQFRKAWDENDTGLHILENIRDIILIITDHVEAMAKATAEWAATLDFSPVLTKFNEWLDSLKPAVDALMGIVEDFYNAVILPLGKWAVEEGGPQLLQVFIDFNNRVDWDGLREKLKKLWKHLEPFAETVGEGFIIFIDKVATALANFINSPEFEKFLEDVEAWMDSVTPQDVADGLTAIANAIIGFAIGKAVIDGLVAISAFLKLVASLAPALKLAVVVTVAITGLQAGLQLGELIFPDDKELYKSYMSITGYFKLIYDFAVSIFDGIKLFFQDMVRQVTAGFELISNTFKLMKGDVSLADWSISVEKYVNSINKAFNPEGFKPLDLSAFRNELHQTTAAATELESAITEGTEKAKSAVDEYAKDVSQKNKDTAGSFSEVYSKMKESESSTETAKKTFGDLRKELETSKDISLKLGGSFDNVLGSVSKMSTETPVLTEKQKNLTEEIGKTIEKAKNYTQASNDTKTALDKLKTGSDNLVSVTPTLTKSQQDIINSLKGVETETNNLGTTTTVVWDNFELATANAGVGFTGTTNEITKDMDNMSKDLTDKADEIGKAFTEDKWTFNGIGDGLEKSFKKAKEKIKGVWNSIADKLNGEHDFGEGKIRIKLPKFYAMGGFPEDGWFRASHGEMIGSFDNGQSVVANNTQIVEGISAGVYSAVSSALASSNNSNGGYIANTIVVDGEVIARTVTKAQNKQNMRYSPNMG